MTKELKTNLGIFLGGILLLILILLFKTFTYSSKQISKGDKPLSLPVNEAAIQHLSESIKIKTVSYDEPGKTDTAAFDSLRNFLANTYPLVNENLEKNTINSFSLIYKWKGKDSSAKPIILYAHLDVVPVEEVNKAEWKHDPWGGEIADGYVWGRGTLDDKVSAIAIMEAAEKLLKESYTPACDVYFVFGHDEEIGGKAGAAEAAKYFIQRGIKTKFNLDEGGMCSSGVVPFVSKPTILIGTAEKGYMTVSLTVKIKGGHSSKPEKETATGVLTRALYKIDQYSFEKKCSPVLEEFIDYMGPEMAMPMRLVFANKWLFKPIILRAYESNSAEGNAVTKTTSAITLFNAGVKENLIPSEASAIVNFRILTGETAKGTIEKLKEVLGDARVEIKETGNTFEPSPVTSTQSYGFKTTQEICAKVFPDAIVTPFLMIGGTDSKHFETISEALIRCLPVRMDKEQLHTIHGVNERVGVRDFMETIEFYKTLITDLK